MSWISSAARAGVVFALIFAMSAFAETKDGTWTKKAPLPVAMTEVGVGEIDGKIYVVGGGEQKGSDVPVSARTLMYDPARDAWQDRAPLPRALTHVGVTGLDGKLYAVGGFAEDVHMYPQDLAFVYDPKTDRWSALPKISSKRGSVAAAGADGKLHVFGGRISNKVDRIHRPGGPDLLVGLGTVTTHEIYDPATGIWSEGKALPGPTRDHLGIAVLDGKIHVLGGRINEFDIVDRHDVYDPKTETWTVGAPLPGGRSAGAAVAFNGRILYAGGECKPGGMPYTPNTFEDVFAYDPKTNSWTSLTPLPQPVHGFGAATVRGIAYFAAGAPLCGGSASTGLFALTYP